MSKDFVVNVNIESEESVSVLRKFMLEKFKADNLHFYCVDVYSVYSGCYASSADSEDLEHLEERVEALKGEIEEDKIRNYGVHMLFGETLEEQVENTINYIKSGLCIYLAVFDTGPNGTLGEVSLNINIYKDGECDYVNDDGELIS